MERIRTYIAGVLTETQGRIEYELLEKGETYWFKTLGEKSACDRDILNTIINEEVARYYGNTELGKTELPVLLTKEEAVSIAKALGGDDKAADIKAEICAMAASAEVIKEEPIKG